MIVRGKSGVPSPPPPPLYREFRVGFESRLSHAVTARLVNVRSRPCDWRAFVT